jgi:hypothetical protein
MFPQYSTGMSLINPQDAQGLLGAALPQGLRSDMMGMAGDAMDKWRSLGMNTDAMQGAQMLPNQAPQMTAPEQGMSQQDMMKMAGQAMQGMGRSMQMPMPSANTAQIIRDNNQFRFAGTPQQQMANALRRR